MSIIESLPRTTPAAPIPTGAVYGFCPQPIQCGHTSERATVMILGDALRTLTEWVSDFIQSEHPGMLRDDDGVSTPISEIDDAIAALAFANGTPCQTQDPELYPYVLRVLCDVRPETLMECPAIRRAIWAKYAPEALAEKEEYERMQAEEVSP